MQKKRFLNLPYAMWTSGPLNIDAAEHLRVSLEKWGLEPKSSIKPQLTIPASVPGHELRNHRHGNLLMLAWRLSAKAWTKAYRRRCH
ncbi:hypothetical protein JCM18909_3618 [Cutibacterium acnes JCM 18909]|nr:hypothetical protein JCM18909_3618 [Cutibacterium acnes JCM 18909]